MSYYRSYFEKNNTLIKDSQVNTAKNPTTEIFYGSGFSKYIFKVDLSDLQEKVDNGYYVIDDNTKHILKLTNTIFGDETFLGADRGTGRERTTSFDLIVFRVPEFWDEGVGFDYQDEVYDFTIGNKTFDERPSNWFNRTTLYEWSTHGIYTTSPDIIDTVHFDNGNENLSVDITDYINGIIVSGNTNYGLGIAFSTAYQDIESEADQSVAFFSKYTQTFFEPYVETVFVDRIDDNRDNFVQETTQNLYLYVTKNGNYYDLDDLPLVDILDSTQTVIVGLSDLEAVKVRKGIYKVSFGISGVVCDGKKFFYDKWKNLSIDGVSIDDVTQKFIPKPLSSKYGIGQHPTEIQKYVVKFSGIKQNEKIKSGELRKILVEFKSINQLKNVLVDEAYFRMFIYEGKTEVIVHDWTQIDKTSNENCFFLETSAYIPREYHIQIKGRINTEEIYYDELIKFEIVSEK